MSPITRSLKGGTLCVMAVLALALSLPLAAWGTTWEWITPQRVKTLVGQGSGLWLVDIRGAAAFERLHAEGAVHVPKEVIASRSLPRQKVIVLVDDSLGLRSARSAAAQLVAKGLDKVYILDGGLPAWRTEGLPVAGKGERGFPTVGMADLKWAQENSVPLRILDLRGEEERQAGPLTSAEPMPGNDLEERLAQASELLRNKDAGPLKAKLEKPQTTVLVLPADAAPVSSLERHARLLPGDIRYLPGGLVAWDARHDNQRKVIGGCPTCPSSAPERITP